MQGPQARPVDPRPWHRPTRHTISGFLGDVYEPRGVPEFGFRPRFFSSREARIVSHPGNESLGATTNLAARYAERRLISSTFVGGTWAQLVPAVLRFATSATVLERGTVSSTSPPGPGLSIRWLRKFIAQIG